MSGLGTRVDRDRLGAIERLEIEGRSERSLSHRDGAAMDEINPVPFERRMGSHPDEHVQVSRRTATGCRRTASGEPKPLTVVNTGRDLDFDVLACAHAPVAVTLGARVRNDLPGPLTPRARRRSHQLAKDGLADLTHFAAAITLAATFGMGAGFTAAAVATIARTRDLEIDVRGDAERGLGEIELHGRFRVLPAGRSAAPSTETTAATGEEGVEDVTETEGLAGWPGRVTPTVVTEGVVSASTLRVSKDLIRCRHFFEAFLGLGVSWIRVGMQLPRLLAVRAFDLVVGRTRWHAEEVVEVRHQVGGNRSRPSC